MIRKTSKWLLRIILWFFAVTILWVIALRFIDPPLTYLMVQRGIEQNRQGQEWKIEKKWLAYEQISDHLKRAAIAGEDARFTSHWGFDTEAIKDAYNRNKEGGNLRGGSTISQQTAKNVFLWPQRSWLRKGLEAYFTILIEVFWSKKRILEVYLNVIETGPGIYGAEAASRHYFGKSASELTRRQASLIIAVLPNPRRWSPAQPTDYISRRASAISRYLSHSQIP